MVKSPASAWRAVGVSVDFPKYLSKYAARSAEEKILKIYHPRRAQMKISQNFALCRPCALGINGDVIAVRDRVTV
jgi:hypothetical protein